MTSFLAGGPVYSDYPVQLKSGDASAVTFGPLDNPVASVNMMIVSVSNAIIDPADITLTDSSGGSTASNYITFSAAPASGTDNVVIRPMTKSGTVNTPADGSISAVKLQNNAVTTDKLQDNSITLNKMAHGLDGNLISFNSVGAPAYVSTGSAAEVLTSNGAGAAPTFQTPAAGGNSWSNSSKGSFTNATEIEFTSLPNVCRILLFFSTAPGTATGFLSKDNGTTYETGNVYMFNRTSQASATATPNVYQDNNASSIYFGDKSEYREIIIAGAATTNVFTAVKSVSFADNNKSLSTIFANYNGGKDVTNAFKVTFSTGSGEYRLDIPTAL